jgi:hypothetical protein
VAGGKVEDNRKSVQGRAATAYLLARHRTQTFDDPGIGFEFSNRTFDAYMANLPPLRKQQLLQKALASTAEGEETRQAAT